MPRDNDDKGLPLGIAPYEGALEGEGFTASSIAKFMGYAVAYGIVGAPVVGGVYAGATIFIPESKLAMALADLGFSRATTVMQVAMTGAEWALASVAVGAGIHQLVRLTGLWRAQRGEGGGIDLVEDGTGGHRLIERRHSATAPRIRWQADRAADLRL